jgi:PEP-CTERM/exosortase A-associated glycosyltransferase
MAILREQRRLGWETRQLTTPRHGRVSQDVAEAEGWQFERTRVRSSALDAIPGMVYLREMAATATRIREVVADFGPDILHAHSPVLNALPALWAGRRLGIPVVYEMRASWEDAAVDHGVTAEGSLRYRASRALETFALRRADGVTTICDGLCRDIAARTIARQRITVIPNGVDLNEFTFDNVQDPVLRASLGLRDRTVIGFVGSFYAYEGLDVLIDALTMLASDHPDVSVLLVGGGPQEANLKAMVAGRGLSDRVVFAGRVPHAEIARYYALIDVLAYPRRSMRLTEIVTPLKPLEAMAQGRIVIASDVGGHRELVRDGETGFLFRAGDAVALARAVAAVLGQRDEWPRIRGNARRFVETQRTWSGSVARYADVYGPLCAISHVAMVPGK